MKESASLGQVLTSQQAEQITWQQIETLLLDHRRNDRDLPQFAEVLTLRDDRERQNPRQIRGSIFSQTAVTSDFGDRRSPQNFAVHSSAIPKEGTEREPADILPSLNILPLFAIARTTLEEGEKALINKTYSILAGVSQSKSNGDKEEPLDLPFSNIDEPLSLDVLLHISENIQLTTERFKLLQYDPLNRTPQFVEFPFQVIVPGSCTLEIHFYHERRWLTAIQMEFEAIEKPQQTTVAPEV
jgi:hypothetical protein